MRVRTAAMLTLILVNIVMCILALGVILEWSCVCT